VTPICLTPLPDGLLYQWKIALGMFAFLLQMPTLLHDVEFEVGTRSINVLRDDINGVLGVTE